MSSAIAKHSAIIGAALWLATAGWAVALTTSLSVVGGDEALKAELETASAVLSLPEAEEDDAQSVIAAALSDYRNLIATLYGKGFYSGVVRVRVNGREAADIPLLEIPARVRRVDISVDPGKPFVFGNVVVAPLPAAPPNPVPLPAKGNPARAGEIRDAVDASISAWRDAGHAKVTVAGQRAVADHVEQTLSVETQLSPGPQVVFGDLVQTADSAVSAKQIHRIAGLPTGQVFSPATLRTVATRLERTGAFSSVSLSEAEVLGPDADMDIGVTVVDAKPRRFGFGAEVSTDEGVALSGFWLHRNYLGGAERLRVDAHVTGIASGNGTDALLSSRLDRPAVFGPDTNGFVFAEAERLDEPDYTSERLTLGVGASRIYSEQLDAEVGVALNYSRTDDDLGEREFFFVSLPGRLTWDRRDDPLTPSAGVFINAEVTPFLGLNDKSSGIRSFVDVRTYRALDAAGRFVLAGRAQLGSVAGAAIDEIHPDFLFFSGGSSTVRGQPFQSLNVTLADGSDIGGRSFASAAAELRVGLRERLSAVGFYDVGYVSEGSFWDGDGVSHSGAGVGVRYLTPIGPLRVDLAGPVGGDTGDGLQLYIGIGQAF